MSRHDAPRPNVELHIEELLLEGFAPHERHLVAAALEQHLALLLAQQFSDGAGTPALFARGAHVARIDAGTFQMPAGTRPERAGEQIALAVHKGISK